jgi:hypothetical protein
MLAVGLQFIELLEMLICLFLGEIPYDIAINEMLQSGVAELAQSLKQGVEAFVEYLLADENVG